MPSQWTHRQCPRSTNPSSLILLLYTQTEPITGSLKIGQELSLVVYLKDPVGNYDVAVRDCWAYDDSDVTSEKTTKLQLTTEQGCIKYDSLFRLSKPD